MPQAKTLNARDAKLVQWLTEAYAKEAELEADLTAHIALTEKMSYKKRLRKHLTETRDHKRRVASRIKQIGGTASASALPGVPNAVGEVAGKAVAAVKGQVGAARAAISPQAETHLRNAQEELREEHVEIAIYTRIESVRHRGGRQGHRAAGQEHPPRRGAHGEVPRRRAGAAGQGGRPGRDPARPADHPAPSQHPPAHHDPRRERSLADRDGCRAHGHAWRFELAQRRHRLAADDVSRPRHLARLAQHANGAFSPPRSRRPDRSGPMSFGSASGLISVGLKSTKRRAAK